MGSVSSRLRRPTRRTAPLSVWGVIEEVSFGYNAPRGHATLHRTASHGRTVVAGLAAGAPTIDQHGEIRLVAWSGAMLGALPLRPDGGIDGGKSGIPGRTQVH